MEPLSIRDILTIIGFSLLQLVVNVHNTYWQFQINMPPIIIEQNFDNTSSPGASGIFYGFPYIPHIKINEDISKPIYKYEVLRHEYEHLSQYRKYGPQLFSTLYIIENQLHGYKGNRFEIEQKLASQNDLFPIWGFSVNEFRFKLFNENF